MSTKVLGRGWFYDTGDPPDIEVWVHSLESMNGRRNLTDWASEHFKECYSERNLRELLQVPLEGNYQVIFQGDLDAKKCGPWEAPDSEWDEWFELESSTTEKIP